jgi:hypothetical protein
MSEAASPAASLNGRRFFGEEWNRETWFSWICTLNAFTWDRDLEPEAWDFMGEWFRSIFDGGKSDGFVQYEKR